jgi:transcriptional regulator with GAF, ATPase, and Fis domain
MPATGSADELAGVFARMSGVLLTEGTVETALRLITSLATDTIAGSDGAGVTLLDSSGTRTTSAATDPLVERLDSLQYELDEGPCLTAWSEHIVVSSGDLFAEKRWGTWSPRASELGARSVLSAALLVGDDSIGAMKVYSRAADAFDDLARGIMERFAAESAILVANMVASHAGETLSAQLKDTLAGRETIAMARGVVMARQEIDRDEAYRWLIGAAERSRVPLRQLAERIIDGLPLGGSVDNADR